SYFAAPETAKVSDIASENVVQSRRMELCVNGEMHDVTSRPDSPLLYVLRNELGLTAPKFGCGVGDCGACGGLENGRGIRSCRTRRSAVEGEITTREGLPGLRGDGGLHPVQQAWIDEQVPQCGYCQNGMIIAAVDLLERVPDPSVAEIRQAFSEPEPHLCR